LLSFRISGQGKSLFGDGIALWITQSSFYSPGELHGSKEKFVGVGIIFDTFRNSENSATHKDITILVNDGEQTLEMMAPLSVGCDSNFRFHADRADFTVASVTRAKILVEQGRIGIAMDLIGNGEYIDCAIVDNPSLPRDWLKKAHVGITATTGALADNHDIISLQSFSDFEVLESYDLQSANSKYFEPAPAYDRQGRMRKSLHLPSLHISLSLFAFSPHFQDRGGYR
jgi:lectin, mannose-binding 2